MAKYDIFLDDLAKIKDANVRSFTESALEAVDDNFYTAPSSASGKYHPPEDKGMGGVVRHVKKGVYVVERYARRAMFSDMERDIALSAYILLDTCKNGVVWGKDTDYTHGYLAFEWLQQFKLEDAFAKEVLTNAVRFHMAPWVYRHVPWSRGESGMFTRKEMEDNMAEMHRALTQPTKIELAVRDADYWAAQEGMSYLPGASIIGRHDAPEELAKRYGLEVEDGVLVTKK